MKTIGLTVLLLIQSLCLLLQIGGRERGSAAPAGLGMKATPAVLAKPKATRPLDSRMAELLDFEAALDTGRAGPNVTVPAGFLQKPLKRPKLMPAALKQQQRLGTADYLKVEWSRQRMATWRQYAPFFAEHRVSAGQIPRIVELLTSANASAGLARTLSRESRESDPVPFAAEVDAHEALAQELGPDLYAALNTYTASLPARREVGIYSDVLQSVGLQLTDAQRNSLVEAMCDPEWTKAASGPPGGSAMPDRIARILPPPELEIFTRMIKGAEAARAAATIR